MKIKLSLFFSAVLSGLLLQGCEVNMAERMTQEREVVIYTNQGDIRLELFPERAPVTVENFLRYAKDGFYEGLIFHRVMAGFVIQGGGLTQDFEKKPTRSPIVSEADNGLLNVEGSIAMARTSTPDSATSQFFINLKHNEFLDYSDNQDGYTVFGKVISGMDIVHKIAQVPVAERNGRQNVPAISVIMQSVLPVSSP